MNWTALAMEIFVGALSGIPSQHGATLSRNCAFIYPKRLNDGVPGV